MDLTSEERNQLLDTKIDASMTVRDASSTIFVQWLINKVNGATTFNSTVAEITSLNMLPGSFMSEDTKIEYLLKLKSLGVQF